MSEFKKALEKYAQFVINKSRQNLQKGGRYGTHNKSGALSKSLEYRIKGDKVSFSVSDEILDMKFTNLSAARISTPLFL